MYLGVKMEKDNVDNLELVKLILFLKKEAFMINNQIELFQVHVKNINDSINKIESIYYSMKNGKYYDNIPDINAFAHKDKN